MFTIIKNNVLTTSYRLTSQPRFASKNEAPQPPAKLEWIAGPIQTNRYGSNAFNKERQQEELLNVFKKQWNALAQQTRQWFLDNGLKTVFFGAPMHRLLKMDELALYDGIELKRRQYRATQAKAQGPGGKRVRLHTRVDSALTFTRYDKTSRALVIPQVVSVYNGKQVEVPLRSARFLFLDSLAKYIDSHISLPVSELNNSLAALSIANSRMTLSAALSNHYNDDSEKLSRAQLFPIEKALLGDTSYNSTRTFRIIASNLLMPQEEWSNFEVLKLDGRFRTNTNGSGTHLVRRRGEINYDAYPQIHAPRAQMQAVSYYYPNVRRYASDMLLNNGIIPKQKK